MNNWDKVKEMMDVEEVGKYITNPFCSAVHKLRQEKDCRNRNCVTCNEWLKQEYKPQILTDKEREYLSNVIEPFKYDVSGIIRRDDITDNYDFEHLEIVMDSTSDVSLPISSTEYKNMTNYRKYTLEELGL